MESQSGEIGEIRSAMAEVYLFDWGDTLMVDFPGMPGKMCEWEAVEAVEGAEEALKFLTEKAQIYVATGAAKSTESDIRKAFNRVGLDKYITAYFCKANLGVEKGSPEFLSSILAKLGLDPTQVTMVGDSFEKDIEPALKLGIKTIWLCQGSKSKARGAFKTISSLKELCPVKVLGYSEQSK